MAEAGNQVVCVDVDAAKIAMLQEGEIPIHEPGLADMVRRNFAAGRLSFTTDVAKGVQHGLFQFIAVGTPPDEDGSADLQYVLAVARSIGAHMDDLKIIINKSTVPVGTAAKVNAAVAEVLAGRGVEVEYDVVSNPEFLKEGAAIGDFMKPNRIIIGTDSDRAAQLLKEMYKPFSRNHDKLILMDIPSAELTKYAANTMLATKISFMNELSNIADLYGADIEQVRIGIGSDPRIGYEYIYPGIGYGGSCFPKDVTALAHSAGLAGYEAELVQAVERVNSRQKDVLGHKIIEHFGGSLAGKTIAVWGLAFKPKTDDMREAPSRVLIRQIWAAGGKVRAFDPEAMDEARRIFDDQDGLELCNSAADALEGSDALAVVTEWQEFRSLDLGLIAEKLAEPTVFDGRNIYDPETMSGHGFTYHSIGRPVSKPDTKQS
jgi:UDPglucose 6-dehydrogenase